MSIFKSTHFLSLASQAIFRGGKKDIFSLPLHLGEKKLSENFHITKTSCDSLWRLHVDLGICRLTGLPGLEKGQSAKEQSQSEEDEEKDEEGC